AAVLIAVSPRSAAIAERLGTGRAIALGFGLIGMGMAVFAAVSVDTPYCVLLVGMVFYAAGAAVAMAPATASILSAVPLSKAGVGSAVNDTTRELGGALGIAIFGSIVNSVYLARIDLSGLGLPAPLAHAGEQSIGAATGVAAQVGGQH